LRYVLTFFHYMYQWFLRKRQNSVGQINSLSWPREPSAHGKKLVPQGAVASKILLPSARHERLNEPKTTLETDHYAVRVPLPDLDPPIKSSNPGGRITIEKIADVTCSDNQVSSSLNCQHLVPSEHIAARYSAKNFQQPNHSLFKSTRLWTSLYYFEGFPLPGLLLPGKPSGCCPAAGL